MLLSAEALSPPGYARVCTSIDLEIRVEEVGTGDVFYYGLKAHEIPILDAYVGSNVTVRSVHDYLNYLLYPTHLLAVFDADSKLLFAAYSGDREAVEIGPFTVRADGDYSGRAIVDCGPVQFFSAVFEFEEQTRQVRTGETVDVAADTGSYWLTNISNYEWEMTDVVICWNEVDGWFGFSLIASEVSVR